MKQLVLLRQLLILLMCSSLMYGCKKEDSYYVAPRITNLDFAPVQSLIAGTQIDLRPNTHDGTLVFWDFGDGTTQDWANSALGTHTFRWSGIFTITLTANHDTGSTKRKNITILPNYSFTYSGTPVVGSTVSFHFPAFLPTGNTYLWKFGDGASSTDSIPTHVYTTSGTFNVTMVVNNKPTLTTSKTVVVYKQPTFMKLVASARTWTGGTQQTDNGAATPIHDSTLQITMIDPQTIGWGSAVLSYSPSLSSGTVVVFTLGADGASLYKTVTYDYAADNGTFYSKTVTTPKTGVTHTTVVSYHLP